MRSQDRTHTIDGPDGPDDFVPDLFDDVDDEDEDEDGEDDDLDVDEDAPSDDEDEDESGEDPLDYPLWEPDPVDDDLDG